MADYRKWVLKCTGLVGCLDLGEVIHVLMICVGSGGLRENILQGLSISEQGACLGAGYYCGW